MNYALAPMEGITGSLYRRTHARHFPGLDRYFIPFLEPREGTCFDRHDCRECDPAENQGIYAIPQLLTNRPDRFLEGAKRLADLGYDQVNLNLGCPARTVVTRGKGSGLLGDLEGLKALLDPIFAQSPLPISLKTRLGVADPEEFAPLLELYRSYPLAELIVHARVQQDQYTGPIHLEAFRQALDNPPWPVCYNGDLHTPQALLSFQASVPQVDRVMLGRGLIANPALVREASGGPALTRSELADFQEDLFQQYQSRLSGTRNLLCWMKELWSYWHCLFPQGDKAYKALRKARQLADYREAVRQMLAGPLVTEVGYHR